MSRPLASQITVEAQEPFAPGWTTPRPRYVDARPLLALNGSPLFRIVPEAEGSLAAVRDLETFPLTGAPWAQEGRCLYRWSEGPVSLDDEAVLLPASRRPDDGARLSVALPSLVVSQGRQLTRVDLTDEGGRVVRSRSLGQTPLGIFAHPLGVLAVEQYSRRLVALDPQTLAVRWSLPRVCCAPVALLSRRAYAVREAEPRVWSLAEIEIETGAVLRELRLVGPPVAPMVQAEDRLYALVEDDTGILGERTSGMFLQTIDLGRMQVQSTDLGATMYGFGSVLSSMEPIVGPGDEVVGLAIAVNGEAGRLRWIDAEGQSEATFYETDRNEGAFQLAQLGPSLAVGVSSRVHIFDTRSREYLGAIELPDVVRRIDVVLGDLLVVTDERSYRLRPVEASELPPAEVALLRVEPYRFGDLGRLRDGDPWSRWQFVGHEASFDVVFAAPTLVPQIRLYPGAPDPVVGSASTVRTTFHGRERGGPTADAVETPVIGAGPVDLVPGVRVARRVSIAVSCRCPARSLSCGSCGIAEVEIEGAPPPR